MEGLLMATAFWKKKINEILFKILLKMPSVYFLIKQRSQSDSCDFVGLMIVEHTHTHKYPDFEGMKGWVPGR